MWHSFSSPSQAQAQELTPQVETLPAALERIFTVNIPASFKELATMTALNVEGEALFGGPVTFQNGSIFDGQITLQGDIIGEDVSIDLGGGALTASNVLYSLEEGDGITISEGQTPTITNSDRGSSQNIFKKIKLGSDTAEADGNSDTLEFAAGSGISLSIDTDNDKLTISNSTTPGVVKSGTYAILADSVTRLGVGTSTPGNTVEISSGTSGASGLTFTNLTSASSVGSGGGKVLSVDSGGNVILVTDESGGVSEGDLDSALPGGSTGSTVYFDGSTWAHSTNLYHNGGQVGISTIPGTNIRFDVKTNATTSVGMVIRRVTSQSANLMEFRNESDAILSYFDSSGVFNGTIAGSGSFNPGFTTGSIAFQGASSLTQDNTNLFWDDSTNRLGIGTNAPAGTLHVETADNIAATFSRSSNARLNIGNQANYVNITGLTSNGGAYRSLMFETISGGTMYLDTDGDVGIGTTAPSTDLDIVTAAGAGPRITLRETSGGTSWQLGGNIITGASDEFAIYDNGNSATRFLIESSGDVGIGTTAPGNILELSRSQNATTDLIVRNANGGTAARSVLSVLSDSAIGLNAYAFGSGYTSSGLNVAQRVLISGNGTGGLALGNTNASGEVGIFAGGLSSTNVGLLVDTSQRVGIGRQFTETINAKLEVVGKADEKQLVVKAHSTQNSNLTEWQNSSAAILTRINQSGQFFAPYGEFVTTSSSLPALVVRGVSNQTANILRVQKSDSTDQLIVDASGNVAIGPSTGTSKFHVEAPTGASLTRFNQTGNGDIFTASGSGTTRLRLTAAGQMALGTSNIAAPVTELTVFGSSTPRITFGNATRTPSSGFNYIGLSSNGQQMVYNGGFNTGTAGYGHVFITDSGNTELMRIEATGNVGIGATTFGTSAARVLALASSTAPSTAISNGIQLFAVDVAGSHELRVMDEAANITTLSPHNFSVIGDASEEMAWSFYSERNSLAINADMTKALRLVEKLSGEKLIYLKDLESGFALEDESDATHLAELADKGTIGEIAKWNYELWTFVGQAIFEKPVTFLASIRAQGPVWLGGKVTFADKDMAGYAIIPAQGREVRITFSTPFEHKPVVSVEIENSSLSHTIKDVDASGFTIAIPELAQNQTTFHWIALRSQDAQTTTGQTEAVSQPAPSPSPNSQPSPSPSPSSQPSSTDSSESGTLNN
jgi:hypothetical protein